MTAGDVQSSEAYNGAAYRMRKKVPTIKFAYPKEGIEGWMDNVAVLKNAPDMENAKLFQNFVLCRNGRSLEPHNLKQQVHFQQG